jgi:DnaJ-class molecular chaperone
LRPPQHATLHVTVPLTERQAALADPVVVTVQRRIVCPHCRGGRGTGGLESCQGCAHSPHSGRVPQQCALGPGLVYRWNATCRLCHGHGVQRQEGCQPCRGLGALDGTIKRMRLTSLTQPVRAATKVRLLAAGHQPTVDDSLYGGGSDAWLPGDVLVHLLPPPPPHGS